MLDLDLLFHILELIATFAAGAWTGNQRCRVAFCLSTDEERKESWLDRCWPRKRARRDYLAVTKRFIHCYKMTSP